MLNITFIGLFPEPVYSYFKKGIFEKALHRGAFSFSFINLRDFSDNKHRKVDDSPFSDSVGMLLKPDVCARAIESVPGYKEAMIIYPSPKGRQFQCNDAKRMAADSKNLVFLCGYYEGIDHRLIDIFRIQEMSLGDFILTSGELPAMAMSDAILRHIPGIIGNKESIEDESVLSGLLETGQFTHPKNFREVYPPDILFSGHHKRIKDWRREVSINETLFKRPDLFIKNSFKKNDKAIITSLL